VDSKDDDLLAAAREGNHEAFISLYQRHGKSIFSFLHRLLDSEKAAEDISHDCFIDLIREPEHFKSNGYSLLIQLYRRARDLAVQYLNQIGKNRQVSHGPGKDRDESSAGFTHGESVRRAINRLPLLEREVLLLFEYERLPLNEIAVIVGSNSEIVSMRLSDARRNLRNELSRYLS